MPIKESVLILSLGQFSAEYGSAASTGDEDRMAGIQAEYSNALLQLHAMGWSGALGEASELPDALMPVYYITNRTHLLNQLEDELSRLAIAYRTAPTSAQMDAAVASYHRTLEEMYRIGHWHGEPDADSQLPMEDMPVSYLTLRNERIRRFKAN